MTNNFTTKAIFGFCSFSGYVGAAFISMLHVFFNIFKMIFKVIKSIVTVKFYVSQFPRYLLEISFFSIVVVFLTSIFTGAVLTMQAYKGLSFLMNSDTLASVVVSAIIRELGPVLTGLMIAGRISSSISAEISTMNNTDQVEALKTLSINPFRYLVVPRILAGVISMPLLLLLSDTVALMGSYFVATIQFSISQDLYLTSLVKYFNYTDCMVGVLKSVIFGAIITLVGCFKGLSAARGSEGVGRATTESVVLSSILILVFNYIISFLSI